MPATQNVPPAESSLQRAREELTRALTTLGRWVDAHGTLTLAALLAIYFLADLGYSLAAPLWHDELFTFYIAQARTLGDMLSQTRTIDLNPPLSYLLTRAGFHLFGVGTLQTRLPEILGFALAMIGTFLFIRRRAGSAYGVLAATLLFAGPAGDLSIQARPYGLLLGFSALSLAAWQTSTEAGKSRAFLNTLLFLALTALLLSHLFGLMTWGALLCGEVFLIARRRRIDIPRILAMLLPLAAGYFYLPILRNHGQSLFPRDFSPSPEDLYNFYLGHIGHELLILGVTALAVVAVAGRRWLRPASGFPLTPPEWVVTLGILLAPLILIVRLMLQEGAFFERYGVTVCLGVAILAATLLAYWTANRPAAAVLAIVLALLFSSRALIATAVLFQQRAFHHTEPLIEPSHLSEQTADLPLVAASGLTFLEMQHREQPALLARTFYLTGGPFAIQYAHATIFESMAWEADHFHLPAHVDDYTNFVQHHPRFYVFGTYDYPEDWLLRKLQADGAQITRTATVESTYKDNELYLVTYPANQ